MPLDDPARLIDIDQLLRRHLPHHRASSRHQLQPALGGQPVERFPNRRARHPDGGGNLLLL